MVYAALNRIEGLDHAHWELEKWIFHFLKCFRKSYRTVKYIKIDLKYVLIPTQIKEIILIKKYSVCLVISVTL